MTCLFVCCSVVWFVVSVLLLCVALCRLLRVVLFLLCSVFCDIVHIVSVMSVVLCFVMLFVFLICDCFVIRQIAYFVHCIVCLFSVV